MSARRALLVSIVLHVLLTFALLGIVIDGESPAPSTPRLVRAHLVASDVAVAADASSAQTPRADDPLAESAAAEPPQVTRAAETPEPAVAATELEPAAPPPEPTPAAAAAPTPAPTSPVESARLPAPVEPRAPEPLHAQVPDAREAPQPPPVAAAPAAALSAAERAMLDERAATWSARIDALVAERAPVEWTHGGHAYVATFTSVPAGDAMGIDEIVVAVRTERDGNPWSTEMRMRRLAFSSFAQFVDRWDSNVQIHDDVIDGRFHSNSEIYVANSGDTQPAFLGKVTTASSINTSQSRRRVVRSEVFLGGLETRAGKIPMTRTFTPFAEDVDAGRVHRFTADAHIAFRADGSFEWRDVESSTRAQRVALSSEPHYLVAENKSSLHVEGIVNGKVLVYAPRDIVIVGNLVYAADPRHADADDYLGLVADRAVAIAEPATTGPGDLTVHASIYARSRFAVRDYRIRDDATLFIHGSLSAGTISATEPRFRTQLTFDSRFARLRPPSFPLTDRYEMDAADLRWTTAPPPSDQHGP